MKKKIVTICLVAIVAVTAIAGASLAYLTDTKTEDNVFTVGKVEIDLLETSLHRDNDNATDAQLIESDEDYQDYLKDKGANMVPGRWVMKAPYVYNTGKNPAYVRIVATMDKAVYDAINIMLYTTATDVGAIDFSITDDIVEKDGKVTMTFTYTEPLEPGKITYYAPFWKFQIMENLDNADLTGIVNLNNVITVRADAIQSEGFDTAAEAFTAFDAQN